MDSETKVAVSETKVVPVVVPEVESKALAWPDQARATTVIDQGSYNGASEALLTIKGLMGEIKNHHRPVIEAANATWKVALAAEKRLLEPLSLAEVGIKYKLSTFLTEQERLRKEEQRRLEEEARVQAEEDALRDAIQAEEEAKASGADPHEIEQQTAAILDAAPEMVVPVIAPKTFVQQAGISQRMAWGAQVTSIRDLARAVADGKAAETLISANMPALNQMAKALKKSLNIPGVRAVETPIISARR